MVARLIFSLAGVFMMSASTAPAAEAGFLLKDWTEAVTLDAGTEAARLEGPPKVMPADGRAPSPVAQAPFGRWRRDGSGVVAEGLTTCWSTMLAPGDQAGAKVRVAFQVTKSSGAARQLPGGCVRWGFHWGENVPGWDFGIVFGYQDPLNFYRLQVSAARSELALWDATGGFLQLITCDLKLNQPAELLLNWCGAHIQASLNDKPLMDYWDRTLPYTKGRVGLAAWKSEVQVADFAISPVTGDSNTAPPTHKPNFRLEPSGGIVTGHPGFQMEPFPGVILFDGNEPISLYWKQPVNAGGEGSRGTLYQDAVKLKPGWRPAYYTYIGPNGANWVGRWAELTGDLPAAFAVTGNGEVLSFAFRTQDQGIANTDYTCTVRYDDKRGIYRYEYKGKTVFAKPGKTNEFELHDALVFNNRSPGPGVTHRWNPAGHRYWVYQNPAGEWRRMPLADYSVDFSTDYNNAEVPWTRSVDFLYPDPAACPLFITEPGWPQPAGRKHYIGQCTWGYDYHHREVGAALELPAGTERPFTFTFTALPPAEADALAAKAKDLEALAKETRTLIPFNPAGTTFAENSRWGEPSTTAVWQGKGVLDTTVGHGDSRSLRLDAPGQAYVLLYQYLIEQHAPAWEIRGWFRSKDVKGACRLQVKYAYGKDAEDSFTLPAVGSHDWTPFAFTTTVFRVKDCSRLTFEFEGTGQLWLDDISITALPGQP